MAKVAHAIALTGCALLLLLFVQLQVNFDLQNAFLDRVQSVFVTVVPLNLRQSSAPSSSDYVLGVGKADITGPVVQVDLMGYANSSQIGTGLRQRLNSRAFIIGSPTDPNERVLYLVLDTQSGDTAIRNGILEGLQALGSDYAMYTASNVAVTGTHSHSGPGAWLNYLLPQVTTLGFLPQSYQAIVNGTLLSIQRAHESLTPGTLTFGSTELQDANANRSPYAYLANPADERARYSADVDKTMTMLNFQRSSDSKTMGVLTWFPVHGTSMYGNNTITTADNKGVAAHLFEQSPPDNAADGFVAGFSQSNVGDTTPNVNGAWCEDGTNVQCSFEQSLCGTTNPSSEACHGRGPFYGLNDGGTASALEIGRRQHAGAAGLLTSLQAGSGSTAISGNVRSFHQFRDFSNFTFTMANGSVVTTCSGALGYGFAAGTTDGPGAFDFRQNTTDGQGNPLWLAARAALHQPSREQIECQRPKEILLDAGATLIPYQWAPNIVDLQVMRVGQLLIIVSPGEATTMSGRRWKESLGAAATNMSLTGSSEPLVVLGAPANSYTHYIATPEEYGVQRYEGASTLYGQWTINAYINSTTDLLPYLADSPPSVSLDAGPSPPDNRGNSLDFNSPVVYDGALGSPFGDVLTDVNSTPYHVGDNVVAVFQGANPRNDFHLEGTYAAVQSADNGETVADDMSWELLMEWKQTDTVTGASHTTLTWTVPEGTAPGQYKLVYNGDSKTPITGSIKSFTGTSGTFTVA
ncbi:MAG: hypothetical protein Q9162_004036 [Coniocarpon cinnabarinum]